MKKRNKNINQNGFTLVELMVAVVVLLAVMIAVGRIFSTTSDISASGQAISETIQQGVAIEQQLREDIAKLSKEGFIGIRSVAIANNLKGDYFLIDDSLPPEAIIRCDQLMFFTDGFVSPMLNSGTTDFAGQGLAARMYYGHGVQFSQLDGIDEGDNNFDESDDPKFFDSSIPNVLTPWYEGVIEVERRKYTESQDERFDVVEDGLFANGTQKNPNDWTLCRQAIVLGDDDIEDPDHARKTVYMGSGISSHTIFPWDPRIGGANTYPHVLHGRVDIAATQLDDIRQSVLQDNTGIANRTWRSGDYDQQQLVASLFHWPRVESVPRTAIRYDQALMFPALAQGCVSFQIEWTYDEGVGSAVDGYYTPYRGYEYSDSQSQPWWGASYRVDPDDPANLAIGFDTLTGWTEFAINNPDEMSFAAETVDPELIEPIFEEGEGFDYAPVPMVMNTTQYPEGVAEYWAIFGYNGTQPFYENGIDLLNENDEGAIFVTDSNPCDAGGICGNETWRYTPVPSALRITLRLLDRDNRLGSGWTYQFVVDLPERN